ncbi:mechanosensitive ion channel family protein [Marinibaculum pumilum]|uniref:Small-conductance mechanosensitive channel n=1 Tax=Marinibaculum pumilum TaxID=1766165 RepID=A0ABV7L7P0_9PROT
MDDIIDGADAFQARALDLAVVYGSNLLAALLILVAGIVIAGWARGKVAWLLRRSGRVDSTLEGFLSGLARYGVLALTALIVLSQFGVETASLLAVLASAGLAIGLALQGTLSHVAAGVMLLFLRPFRVGEYIDAGGTAGTVQGIDLFATEMRSFDGIQTVVPNGRIWGQVLKNYSRSPTRRADVTIGIDYDADLDRAMAVMRDMVAADGRILADPAPQVFVGALGDSAVALTARFWVASGDLLAVQWDLTKGLKEAFDRTGIGIPFPTRTIHHVGAPSEAAAPAGPVPQPRDGGPA